MRELAQELVDDVLKREANQSIVIRVGDLPSIRGSAPMLRLVLSNLLSNAIKFTRSRSEPIIEIGTEGRENEYVFYVRDNGVGFNMRYANKLFGVFQRLHSSENYEGTGVGLAIVQRIIHRHGGRVWAEGEVNKGATFYFTMPKTEEQR
jgi:two-component system sensor kinase